MTTVPNAATGCDRAHFRRMGYRLAGFVAAIGWMLTLAGVVTGLRLCLVVSVTAAVYVFGPTLVVAGVAGIATALRRECHRTRVPSLAAANAREDRVARP